jgi:hypothetical protein
MLGTHESQMFIYVARCPHSELEREACPAWHVKCDIYGKRNTVRFILEYIKVMSCLKPDRRSTCTLEPTRPLSLTPVPTATTPTPRTPPAVQPAPSARARPTARRENGVIHTCIACTRDGLYIVLLRSYTTRVTTYKFPQHSPTRTTVDATLTLHTSHCVAFLWELGATTSHHVTNTSQTTVPRHTTSPARRATHTQTHAHTHTHTPQDVHSRAASLARAADVVYRSVHNHAGHRVTRLLFEGLMGGERKRTGRARKSEAKARIRRNHIAP